MNMLVVLILYHISGCQRDGKMCAYSTAQIDEIVRTLLFDF